MCAFAGTWNQVPNTPAACKYLYAANPATLRSKWIACASGRAGCRTLDTSWTKTDGRRIFSSRITDSQRIAGGKAMLLTRRLWPGPFPNPYYAYIDVVEPLDDDPLLAIGAAPTWVNGNGRTCNIQAIFGDFGLGFMAHPHDVLNPSAPNEDDIWGWAPWSMPNVFTTHTSKRVEWDAGNAISFQEATMGVDRIWARTQAPSTTALFRLSSKTWKLADGSPISETPSAVPGGVTVFEATQPFSIAFVSDEGVPVRLVTPTSPQFVTSKTVDRSSGNLLVWMESDYGGVGYANSTLWKAPFATSEAGVARTKVAKLVDALERGGARAVANAGVYLSLIGRNTALVTRLSDGIGWIVQGEPKERFVDPVWVDENDVLIETAPDPDGTKDFGSTSILRVARSSLGAPTMPSGL